MKYLLIYLIIINIAGYIIMGTDKSRAKKNQWRISEKTLFITALVGGAVGVNYGMKKFRHKTHHKQFVYGIPAIIFLHAAAAIYAAYIFFIK